MTPSTCPRCRRPASAWTVERERGTAGCPCGEVIEVFFDDEAVAIPRLIQEPETPRQPNAWAESQSTSGWSASFRNDVRTQALTFPLLVAGALVVGILAKLTASGLGWVSAVAFAVAMVVFGTRGKAGVQWFRAWLAARVTSTFSMSEGFLRIRSGNAAPFEVRLADVEHCFAERAQPTDLLVNGAFRLVVRVRDGLPLRMPLHVPSAEEAQFLADRISAMLETDGRAMNVDYRGEPLRVAVPESSVALQRAPMIEEESADHEQAIESGAPASPPLRQRR